MGLSVQCSFDERFDKFWKQLRDRYPDKLLGDRSLATLQWHFHYAMAEGRLWIATVTRDRQLLAYAVFVRDPYTRVGSKISRAVLADFQSLERDDAIYFAILHSALKKCSKDGIALLAAHGFSASGTETGIFAPYCRQLENPQFLYKATDPKLAKALAGPEPWCPSSYDADETL
jgi:hypothetical protein